MTWAMPQRYPGTKGRPGIPVPVDHEEAVFTGRHGRWTPDVVARWSISLGRLDGAASVFWGTSREPQLLPAGLDPSDGFVPRYEWIRQAGLEAQWTGEAWIWKLEAMARGGPRPAFGAATIGFERVVTSPFGLSGDVGLMLEYSYDGRDDYTLLIHDDDLFGGLRIALNDRAGTQFLGGVLRDLSTGTVVATAEASRRLGRGWTVELEVLAFSASGAEDPVYWFRDDDYLELTLAYHF